MTNIHDLQILVTESILTALKSIDYNRKGFLIVTDDQSLVIGTLTDGDIRRAFIRGQGVQDSIDLAINRQFRFISTSDRLGDVIELFKATGVKFLPLINAEGKLINIISKGVLQTILMEDITYSSELDFLKIDETVADHEIFSRPWGFYKTTFLNPHSQSKIMIVAPGGELSLQKHHRREEYWVVVKGLAEVTIGESVKKLESGNFAYIPKGCKHRLKNLSSTESLFVSEVQLGDYFGEDDIIRYSDVYGRI